MIRHSGSAYSDHRKKIDLVNSNHETFLGQSRTVSFNVRKGWAMK